MISVSEASELIVKHAPRLALRNLSIHALGNEVLREALIADRCHPPYHRVAMDGIAINFESWKSGIRCYPIEGCQGAGQEQTRLIAANHCLEVMTGAILPKNCSAVIRYEDIVVQNNCAMVKDDIAVNAMQNIHIKGSDYSQGDILASPGSFLSPSHWAIAATIGKEELLTAQRPQIAVISTGDELVSIEQTPKDHQIRISNVYAISACLKNFDFTTVSTFHCQDQPQQILERLTDLLPTFDVVILSGGVSMGKFDLIPQILSDLKINCLFHGVRQRPGKPLWFGISPEGKPVFGLPGNPISSLISTRRFIIPSLLHALAKEGSAGTQLPYAMLTKDLRFKHRMTYFQPVKVDFTPEARIEASPIPYNGSGDYAALAESDGFLELTENRSVFSRGEAFPLYLWKGL